MYETKVILYQIDLNKDIDMVAFHSLNDMREITGKRWPDPNIYKKVNETICKLTNTDNILEDIYAMYSTKEEEDNSFRRIDISDVIYVEERDKYYYCDDVGFKRVKFKDPENKTNEEINMEKINESYKFGNLELPSWMKERSVKEKEYKDFLEDFYKKPMDQIEQKDIDFTDYDDFVKAMKEFKTTKDEPKEEEEKVIVAEIKIKPEDLKEEVQHDIKTKEGFKTVLVTDNRDSEGKKAYFVFKGSKENPEEEISKILKDLDQNIPFEDLVKEMRNKIEGLLTIDDTEVVDYSTDVFAEITLKGEELKEDLEDDFEEVNEVPDTEGDIVNIPEYNDNPEEEENEENRAPEMLNIIETANEVMRSYQNANKWLDSTKEAVYSDLGCVFFSSFIHRLAHTMPERFDKFGDILHTINIKVPYPTTEEIENEPKDIDQAFIVIFKVLDDIKLNLNKFIKATDNIYHGMACAAEDCLNDIEEEYPMLYRLQTTWKNCNGDMASFDKYVNQYVNHKDELLEWVEEDGKESLKESYIDDPEDYMDRVGEGEPGRKRDLNNPISKELRDIKGEEEEEEKEPLDVELGNIEIEVDEELELNEAKRKAGSKVLQRKGNSYLLKFRQKPSYQYSIVDNNYFAERVYADTDAEALKQYRQWYAQNKKKKKAPTKKEGLEESLNENACVLNREKVGQNYIEENETLTSIRNEIEEKFNDAGIENFICVVKDINNKEVVIDIAPVEGKKVFEGFNVEDVISDRFFKDNEETLAAMGIFKEDADEVVDSLKEEEFKADMIMFKVLKKYGFKREKKD